MMMTDDTVLIPVMMDAGEESAVRSGVTSLAYKSHEKNKNSVGKDRAAPEWRRTLCETGLDKLETFNSSLGLSCS